MRKYLYSILFLLLILFSNLKSFSQDQVSFYSGLDFPMGMFKWVYNPAVNFNFAYSDFNDSGEGHHVSWDYILGFSQFKPKEDVFYYKVNEFEYGTAIYDNYTTIQLMVGIIQNIYINDKIDYYFGLNLGIYYLHYAYKINDPYGGYDVDNITSCLAMCPRTGIRYKFDEEYGIFYQCRYNVLIEFGDSDPGIPSYNTGLGNSTQFISGNLGFYYRF